MKKKFQGKGSFERKVIYITLLLLLLTVPLLGGCGDKALEQSGVELMRFGLTPDVTCLPMVLAEQEGIYENLGLEVELIYFTSAMERDQAIQAGQIDGAVSDIVATGFFLDSGFDIQITSLNEGNFALVASPESGINSVKDLKGKSIGLSNNTIIEFMVDEILTKNGLTSEEVRKEYIAAIPQRREMMLQGQIDAACMPEPLASLCVEQGALMITDSDKEGILPSVIIFTEEYIAEKPEAIKKFYQAYREAADLINPDPSVYNQLLLEKLRFPEEILDKYEIPHFNEPALPHEEGVQSYLDWLKGRIEKDLTYDDMINKDFVE
ncbi:ABC transporter substrate-binding protein [Candidatus Contubernalis alkaliaceticus]|uniref:ABC transporter substrate-binding protein n=1 Tax=Candidatus Contubernalis alkaliaceticus TaxID=338645 RepID=UPI001F4C32B1|nr:MetQ/NlpA family ABC transporter substrate-binding protein [Candidatus Contubernalis alkalaceticus]UNC92796.1 ABC transporter substrate-binding protein [Candidatus Contubernalis alkalaceticus]